jgi:hypothetical protein
MKNSSLSVAAVLVLAVLSCAGAGAEGNASPANCPSQALPVFPYTQGWLGADDAYSIPLDATRSIWLFGDTFVGNPDTTLRSKAKTMVRNSVGISTCAPSKDCTMKYYWRDPEAEKPRSFFDTGKDDLWYWPLDGFRDGEKFYVSMMAVRNKKGAGPEDPFGFELAGTQWFIVHNVSAPPDQWKMESREFTVGNIWPGASTFAQGEHLMLYTQISEGEGRGYMTVVRVPKSKLADPATNLEYLGADGKWHAGTPGANAMHVIEQAISEMSVRYHATAKKWVAISGGQEWPTKRIVARLADSPTGPWSAPQTIYEFPEMNSANKNYDKDTFCYATKEHVEFGDSQLVITYACNSMVLQKVIDNMELYRPKVVVVGIPK